MFGRLWLCAAWYECILILLGWAVVCVWMVCDLYECCLFGFCLIWSVFKLFRQRGQKPETSPTLGTTKSHRLNLIKLSYFLMHTAARPFARKQRVWKRKQARSKLSANHFILYVHSPLNICNAIHPQMHYCHLSMGAGQTGWASHSSDSAKYKETQNTKYLRLLI